MGNKTELKKHQSHRLCTPNKKNSSNLRERIQKHEEEKQKEEASKDRISPE